MIKKNQIAVNLVTNILAMGISMLISLWITPYLINILGLAAYGYIGLINNITSYLHVITYTLTSMVARFLTVSLERNGPQDASKVMSSALFTNLFFGGLLIPVLMIFGFNLDRFLNIQREFIIDVKISFVLSGIALIINSIYSILTTGAYYKNRLDINNGIGIFSNLVRIIFIITIFSLLSPQIWHFAIASVINTLIILILSVFTFKTLLPDIRFNIKLFKLKLSFELLSSGFFNSIILLGNNFLTQIDLIVGNRYLSAETVGMYAAILLLPNSIRNIATALSYAFSPSTVKLYSIGDMEKLRKYTNKVVKFCGLMIGWPIAIISGLAIPILKTWLGKDFSAYQFTIILMLLPLTINLAVNQLYIVQQATNKVKIPAFAAVIFGVMNIILAVFLTAILKMGIFGIVLSGVAMSTVRTAIFVPIYTAIITNQPKYAYYKGIISPILVTLVTSTVGIMIQRSITINSLISILGSAFCLTILYFTISLVFLSNEERKIIQNKVIPIVKKIEAKTMHA